MFGALKNLIQPTISLEMPGASNVSTLTEI
jgi:hypothetical protein